MCKQGETLLQFVCFCSACIKYSRGIVQDFQRSFKINEFIAVVLSAGYRCYTYIMKNQDCRNWFWVITSLKIQEISNFYQISPCKEALGRLMDCYNACFKESRQDRETLSSAHPFTPSLCPFHMKACKRDQSILEAVFVICSDNFCWFWSFIFFQYFFVILITCWQDAAMYNSVCP